MKRLCRILAWVFIAWLTAIPSTASVRCATSGKVGLLLDRYCPIAPRLRRQAMSQAVSASTRPALASFSRAILGVPSSPTRGWIVRPFGATSYLRRAPGRLVT
ncbi:MAG: hypothetical protein U0835_21675 [Isosphaeraceae bacterium]